MGRVGTTDRAPELPLFNLPEPPYAPPDLETESGVSGFFPVGQRNKGCAVRGQEHSESRSDFNKNWAKRGVPSSEKVGGRVKQQET